MGGSALRRAAVDRHDNAASEPHAEVCDEVIGMVGDAHMDRLVGAQPRRRECAAHLVRGLEKLGEAHFLDRLARGKPLGGFGEQRPEIFYSHSMVAGGLDEMS